MRGGSTDAPSQPRVVSDRRAQPGADVEEWPGAFPELPCDGAVLPGAVPELPGVLTLLAGVEPELPGEVAAVVGAPAVVTDGDGPAFTDVVAVVVPLLVDGDPDRLGASSCRVLSPRFFGIDGGAPAATRPTTGSDEWGTHGAPTRLAAVTTMYPAARSAPTRPAQRTQPARRPSSDTKTGRTSVMRPWYGSSIGPSLRACGNVHGWDAAAQPCQLQCPQANDFATT
jgi:hypothetical protein